ncbi:C1 family peptidase [uncultured Methanospirillum sp.]|uniref:C1 family peptidase n=1 Tax=uncultured Methanospirillum sp. TaxID=262503 RepID=UPI0029C68EDB|nr:C1 family peptidase [uncultured Methanospirillum sp.]
MVESSATTIHETSQNLSTQKTTWKPGVTSLSNLTPEQKKKIDSLLKHSINQSVVSSTTPIKVPANLPESFDWRNNNGDWTTPVHDQGEECGSCWAYAAVSVLESYLKIKSHNSNLKVGLSEQYLISCDKEDSGCDGGDFETAMPSLVDSPGPDGVVGVMSREEYPYTELQDTCKNLSGMKRYHADKWAYVNATSDEGIENSVPPVNELKAAIFLKGPIAVGVQDDDDFDDYSGGIFYSDVAYDDTNHAVVLVGWGNEDGEEYFIGKNSAGTNWGEDGWFRIDVYSNRIGEGAVYLDSA